MARKRLGKVVDVFKLTAGTILDQAMTAASPADGESLSVEQVTDFDPEGGTAVIGNETISYRTIDESTDELKGVVRGFDGTTAASHSIGDFVQESTDPTVEKWARVKIDDEEEIREIPVPAYLYPMLRVGSYTDEEAPTIPVYYDEDEDEVIVMDGPVGAVPTFDQDLEVLPPVGGGDSSSTTTDPDTGKVLPPKGMGYEDGKVPSTGVTPTVTGGVSMLFIRWPTIANNSIVKYKVHVSTTTGFTPSASTLVGTLDLAGTPGFTGSLVVKEFPSGHALTGAPLFGTTYFVKVIPADGSGEFAGPHTEASGTPIRIESTELADRAVTNVKIALAAITNDLVAANAITATKILDGSIETPKLAAGAVTAVKIAADTITANEIAAGAINTLELAAGAVTAAKITAGTITSNEIASRTIVAGDIFSGTITANEIATTTITADRMSVTSLSAISANIGSITAGSITGVTIEGGTFRTAPTSAAIRVEMSSPTSGQIGWKTSASTSVATIICDSAGNLNIFGDAKITLDTFTLQHTGTNLGFHGVAPVARQSINNLTGTDSTTAQLHNKVNATLTALRNLGLISGT